VRFLVSGSSGFVGTYLVGFLRAEGHDVTRLVRHSISASDEHAWDPDQGMLDEGALEEIDVAINLAGASIAGKRWTGSYKQEILRSREGPTRLLAQTMTKMKTPPRVFISVSGVGVYGHHPIGEVLDEGSPVGDTFLADVCKRWEAAAQPAATAGVRVIHPRFGSIMGPGSMLGGLVPMFRAGLGVRLGSGRQAFSWLALDDIGPAMLHCIDHAASGPLNFTAPEVVINRDFTRALAKSVHRPALFSAPGPLLRLIVGGLADEMLEGQHAVPGKLLGSGYHFRFPTLQGALEHYVPQLLHRR